MTRTVETADDERVRHEGTHIVAAETDRVVAGITRKKLKEDQRSVIVTAAVDGSTDSVDFSVDGCHDSVHVSIDRGDGGLRMTSSLC